MVLCCCIRACKYKPMLLNTSLTCWKWRSRIWNRGSGWRSRSLRAVRSYQSRSRSGSPRRALPTEAGRVRGISRIIIRDESESHELKSWARFWENLFANWWNSIGRLQWVMSFTIVMKAIISHSFVNLLLSTKAIGSLRAKYWPFLAWICLSESASHGNCT